MRLPAYYTIPLFICLCSLTGCSDPHEETYKQVMLELEQVRDSRYKDITLFKKAKRAALQIQSENPDWKSTEDGTPIESVIGLVNSTEKLVKIAVDGQNLLEAQKYNDVIDGIKPPSLDGL